MAEAPPVGRRARITRTTPSDYVRTTLLFGAHSSSRLLVASVPRQLVTWTTPQQNCPSPHPSDLFAPRSASTLHCASPRAANTSSKRSSVDLYFFLRLGAEAYAPRATDNHTGINLSRDQRRGPRVLREPKTDLRGTALDYGHRGLGAHIAAPSLWSSLGRNRRARGMFGLSRLAIFTSTRVIVWVAVHASIRLARRTNCCAPFLLKRVQLLI